MEISTAIILFLATAWFFQLFLTYLQMKRFYKKVANLRSIGLTSIGMSGSFFKGKVYSVLVIDEQKIVRAYQLSGFTVFSNLKPIDEIIGFSVDELLDETIKLPVKKTMREALIVAANEIKKLEIKGMEKANV